ncbi:MAG: HK97 gp10 family phage protein [Sulfurovaceae bacterium]|nr:HK97 gp10 family phage protein [Sulfurovaceae bacterium]
MANMTESFANVQKALSKLPTHLQDRVVVGATRAAAQVVADEAKQNVPVDTGLLKKSIGVAQAKKSDTKLGHVKFYAVAKSKIRGTSQIDVGGQKGKLKYKIHAWYAHMVEFGTSKMAAIPFMRPAFENSGEKSVSAFQEYALKRVDKEITKLKK